MRLNVELDDELQHAMELHLEKGIRVQTYFKAALRFFKDCYKQEESGKMIGNGNPDNFKRYNVEMSPKNYLNGVE